MRSSVGFSFNRIGDNERGIVLILCLFMLLLLSILGAFATSTSMTELSIAGNYRRAETALSVADAGIAYGQTDFAIYTTIGNGTCPPCAGTVMDGAGNIPLGTNTAQVRVDYIATGPVQPGHFIDTSIYQANYFAITSTGTGPNNSQARIESQIAKLVPKPGS